MEAIRKIEGTKKDRSVKLYALSTCGWCKKTKKLLSTLDVEYECIDFDLLPEEKKKLIKEEIKNVNPAISFPTVVVDEGEEIIVGFKEDKIKEVLADEG
ncbi:MAG: glutaredoxin family protein [Thermoplasmata archaeon]